MTYDILEFFYLSKLMGKYADKNITWHSSENNNKKSVTHNNHTFIMKKPGVLY